MQAIDSGRLSIEKKLTHILQTFGLAGKERITVRHLLNHSSGYPAWAPLYKEIIRLDAGERSGIMTSRGAVEWEVLVNLPNEARRRAGNSHDLQRPRFILLGHVLEVVSAGMPLDRLAQRMIFKPLDLHSTAYIDISKIRRRGLAPVSEMMYRRRVARGASESCGEVHDDNAYVMGGI